MEIYGASRQQEGTKSNEDAFLVGRGQIPFAALADGSGNAQQAARSALALFHRLFSAATPEEIERFQTWEGWIGLLDSLLLGDAQSTFLAVAFLPGRIVGTSTGDSRLYLLTMDGEIQLLTEDAQKFRLGSGKVIPFPIHRRVQPGDVLMLMSDGAWTPLNLTKMKALRAKALSRHFSEFPAIFLDEAGKNGRADDMTAVAIRVL